MHAGKKFGYLVLNKCFTQSSSGSLPFFTKHYGTIALIFSLHYKTQNVSFLFFIWGQMYSVITLYKLHC